MSKGQLNEWMNYDHHLVTHFWIWSKNDDAKQTEQFVVLFSHNIYRSEFSVFLLHHLKIYLMF
jgi:hypothetical protein